MIETKRVIHSMWFDKDTAECSLTSSSQGGPASGGKTVLLKARLTKEEELSDQEREYLEYIEEEFTPLQKQQGNNQSLSSAKSDAGEEENLTKGNEMSEQDKTALEKAQAEIEALKKQLETKDVSASLDKYGFTEAQAVASAVQGLSEDERATLDKAFSELYTEKVDLEKSVATLSDNQELGEDGEAEIEKAVGELSLNEKMKELNKLEQGA